MRDFPLHTIPVDRHGSSGVRMTFVQPWEGHPVSVNVATFDTSGTLGRHEASAWQVFLVISGRVRVAGGDGRSLDLEAGQAVQWQPGESHESVALEPSVVLITERADESPGDGPASQAG